MSGKKQVRWILALILSTVLCFGELGGTGVVLAAEDSAGTEAVTEVSEEAEALQESPADPVEEPCTEPDVTEPAGATAYELWVGGVQVTDENKDDIPGVTTGKAVFDPGSRTLTLTGVKSFRGKRDTGATNKYYIYSNLQEGLVLKGDAVFTLGEDEVGIYTKNGLDTYANLSMEGAGIGIYNNGGFLNIRGGNIDIRTTADKYSTCCIGCYGDIDIKDATVRAVGGQDAIGADGYVIIARSTVYAEGRLHGIRCQDDMDAGLGFTVGSGGVVTARATGVREAMTQSDNGDYTGILASPTFTISNAASVYAEGNVHGIWTLGDTSVIGGASLEAISTRETNVITGSTCFVGAFSKNGDFNIDDGWLHAKGIHGSMLTTGKDKKINLLNNSKALDPEEVFITNPSSTYLYGTTDGNLVYQKSAMNPVEDVLFGPEPERYSLVVSGHDVTSANKNNIPVKSGRASYDPSTKTLAFEDAVVDTYKAGDYSEAIYAFDDLTITGKVTINKVDASGYGIIGEKSLIFKDADLTAGDMKYAAILSYGDMYITDSVLDVSATGYGLHSMKTIHLENSSVKAAGKSSAVFADVRILYGETVIVSPKGATWSENEKTVVNGHVYAISVDLEPGTKYDLYVGDTQVTFINKDDILGDGKVSYDPDSNKLTFDNVSGISKRGQTRSGQSTYVYYSGNGTLRVEGSLSVGNYADYIIYSEGGLTVAADISNSSDHMRRVLYANNDINIVSGTVNVFGSQDASVAENKKSKACIWSYNGNINMIGGKVQTYGFTTGLYAQNNNGKGGDINVSGGTVEINKGTLGNWGLVTEKGNINITGGSLDIVTYLGNAAVKSRNGSVVIGSDLIVVEPEDAQVSGGKIILPSGKEVTTLVIVEKGSKDCTVDFAMNGHGTQVKNQTVKIGAQVEKPANPSEEGWLFVNWYEDANFKKVFDFENKTIIKNTTLYAKWYEKGDYELWLGDTLVNDQNCQDIFGDGKASYDPATATLTLNGYTGNGTVCSDSSMKVNEETRTALILAKQSLTIEGNASLESSDANYGIMLMNGIFWLDADLTVRINHDNSTGIRTDNGTLYVVGGTVNCEAKGAWAYGLSVQGAKFVISDGAVTSYGDCTGVSTRKKDGNATSLVMYGGVLDSSSTDEGYSLNYGMQITGPLEMEAGILRAHHPKYALNFAGSNIDWTYIDIVKPEGGKINDGEPKYTIVGSDGTTPATDLEIVRRQYTVTFDLEGKTIYGEAPADQKVYKGRTATKPEDPVADGFVFKGWYKNLTDENSYDFESPVTEDITLHAKWAQGLTVSFDVGDAPAVAPEPVSVEEGQKIKEPEFYPPSDYTFQGWYRNLSDETPYDFNTPVTESFTLYARWPERFTVSFDVGDVPVAVPEDQSVERGRNASEPFISAPVGYHFEGWFKNLTDTTPYSFPTPVESSFTLYGKFTKEQFTVQFDLNGKPGTKPVDQNVEYGDKVTKPTPDPVSEGQKLVGWYLDPECTKLYEFTTPVSGTFTLYAKWVPEGTEVYTVTFDLNGQPGTIDAQTVISGEKAVKPNNPVIEGYDFGGWFKDSACTETYDFATPVNDTLTLYAKLTKKVFSVYFDLNGKGSPAVPMQKVEYGGKVKKPAPAPTAENYTLVGWFTDAACTDQYDFKTPVKSGFTLYAKWAEGYVPVEDEGMTWNLFENASEHEFEVNGVNAAEKADNVNAKSAAFYEASMTGSAITVKVKDGVDRKKAAKPANSVLEFKVGEGGKDGVVTYTLPVSYVKPSFKLSTKSAQIHSGSETTVGTKLLYKTPAGLFEPYDMDGVKLDGFADIGTDEDGTIQIKANAAQSGKIKVSKEGWDSAVELPFSIKAAAKDVIFVNLEGQKTVIVNKNLKGKQTFEFDVVLNGAAPADGAIEIEDKKDSKLAAKCTDESGKLTGDKLQIAYPDTDIKDGTYTITLKTAEAKANVKVKVSSKDLKEAVTGKVKRKYDVVTGQSMVIETVMKEVGGKLISPVEVDDREDKADFEAEMNEAGNIEIDYKGTKYNASNLKMGDMEIDLTHEVEPALELEFDLKGVSAKKSTPKASAAQVIIPAAVAEAADGTTVIAAVNIISTCKDGNVFRLINPVDVTIDGNKTKGVTAEKNEDNRTEIDIKKLDGKSGTVKVNVEYPGGVTKSVSIKIKKQ